MEFPSSSQSYTESPSKIPLELRAKAVSNDDWFNPHDPDARIAKLKDGRTHLAYKTEHAVDLSSDLILAAPVYHVDQADTQTMPETLTRAQAHLLQAGSEVAIVGPRLVDAQHPRHYNT